ncbi:MAG: hypothetical protein IKU85_02375 [Bacteroidaceae bacterium]|nr:hypothetical protein [Bacteroidaceae bacterium]
MQTKKRPENKDLNSRQAFIPKISHVRTIRHPKEGHLTMNEKRLKDGDLNSRGLLSPWYMKVSIIKAV